jgi:hypothetical protein
VQPTNPRFAVAVTDERLISHAGVGLLAELADRIGLTGALDRFADTPGRARQHPIPRILRDLVVMLADGGDCLSDLRLLADAAALLGDGPVASIPTAWRAIEQLALDGEDGLARLRLARAVARERAWRVGAEPAGRLIVDLDASLVVAHTDRKQGASGTYKRTFGFSTRCWPTSTTATAAGSRWPRSCAPAAPRPTTPPTTSPWSTSPWHNSPPRPPPVAGSGGRWSAPTAPAPPPPSLPTCEPAGSGFRSGWRSTPTSATRCWPCPNGPGGPRST